MKSTYDFSFFDKEECLRLLADEAHSFEEVAGPDGEISYDPGIRFPYDYDYTCEWDFSSIYIAVRSEMTESDRNRCDQFFGQLFWFRLIEEDNDRPGKWICGPDEIPIDLPIVGGIAIERDLALPEDWFSVDAETGPRILYSPQWSSALLELWNEIDAETLHELARNAFDDYCTCDIFESPEDFVQFVGAWVDLLQEAVRTNSVIWQHFTLDS